MTLEQRLEKLERENRWMRRIGMLAAAVAAAVFLVGQGKEKELQDLVVRSLTVKDADGKVRALLRAAVDGMAALGLHDQDGKLRVLLHAETESQALNFYIKGGQNRAALGTSPDGEAAALVLWDRHARGRVMLNVAEDGAPALTLLDKDGRSRAVLGATTTVDKKTGEAKTTESTLTLYDVKGKVIWKAPKE